MHDLNARKKHQSRIGEIDPVAGIDLSRLQTSAAVTKIRFHLESTQARYQEVFQHRHNGVGRRAQSLQDRQWCSALWRRDRERRRRRSEYRSPRLASRALERAA